MRILLNWLASALIILIVGYILPGVHVVNFWTALVVALVLGIFNVLLKPILVILTLPITILTLGLFLIIINAILVLLASSFVPGFIVDSFWSAILFSILVSLINLVFGKTK